MAKGFKAGAGGGNPLNFKVVAYAAENNLKADTPKENTIGIVTTTKITSWVFSYDEPTKPTAGMVWFATGFNSIAVFNVLKKNTIQVYPLYAKQYVSGAWVDVTAMSYRGGKWVKWVAGLMLYSSGYEYKNITGGFTSYVTGNGRVTKNSTNIYLYTTTEGYLGTTTYCIVHSAQKIDLTHYRTLRVKYTCQDNDLGGKKIFISKSSPTSVIASSNISRGTTETTLDISQFNGEYYVGVGMIPNQSYNAYGHVYVNEIKLER